MVNNIEENLKEISKRLNCDEKKLIKDIKTMLQYSNEEMILEFIHE